MPMADIETFVSKIDSDEAFYDTMYQLYLLYNIKRGEEDVKNGKVLTLEEAKERLANV